LLLPALFAGFSLGSDGAAALGALIGRRWCCRWVMGAAVAASVSGWSAQSPWADPVSWTAPVLVTLGLRGLNVRYSAQNISVFAIRRPTRSPASGWCTMGRCQSRERGGIRAVPGVWFHSAAFDPGPRGFIYPQYSNLLRGLLAVAGRLYSDGLLLKLNAMIGSAALLGFYACPAVHRTELGARRADSARGVPAATALQPQLLQRAGHDAVLGRRARAAAGGARTRYHPRLRPAGLVLGSAALARIDGLYFCSPCRS
jgi:hypothetical protein